MDKETSNTVLHEGSTLPLETEKKSLEDEMAIERQLLASPEHPTESIIGSDHQTKEISLPLEKASSLNNDNLQGFDEEFQLKWDDDDDDENECNTEDKNDDLNVNEENVTKTCKVVNEEITQNEKNNIQNDEPKENEESGSNIGKTDLKLDTDVKIEREGGDDIMNEKTISNVKEEANEDIIKSELIEMSNVALKEDNIVINMPIAAENVKQEAEEQLNTSDTEANADVSAGNKENESISEGTLTLTNVHSISMQPDEQTIETDETLAIKQETELDIDEYDDCIKINNELTVEVKEEPNMAIDSELESNDMHCKDNAIDTIDGILPTVQNQIEELDISVKIESLKSECIIDNEFPSTSISNTGTPDKISVRPDLMAEREKDASITDNTDSQLDYAIPSTSSAGFEMGPDASDEIPEVTDSLGLLAESTRVMEDEEPEEQEPEEEEDDDDGDGDDEQEDESNLVTADHSEDSSAHQSETDAGKDHGTMDSENMFASQLADKMQTVKDSEDMEVDSIEKLKIVQIMPVPFAKLENDELADAVEKGIDELMDVVCDGMLEKITKMQEDNNQIAEVIEEAAKDQETPKAEDPLKEKVKPLTEIGTRNVLHSIVDLASSSDDDLPETKDVEMEDVEEKEVGRSRLKELLCKAGSSLKSPELTVTAGSGKSKPLVIPEVTDKLTKKEDSTDSKKDERKRKFGLEVFSIDSEEEESIAKDILPKTPAIQKTPSPKKETEKKPEVYYCINPSCTTVLDPENLLVPNGTILRFYDVTRRKRNYVCQGCADVVIDRSFELVQGVKDMTPLLKLNIERSEQEFVEISDSETDSDNEDEMLNCDKIGVVAAKMLETELSGMINQLWDKYHMDDRLEEAKDEINMTLEKLETERKELDTMLNECQAVTDKLRNDFYATFAQNIKQLPSLDICDTPFVKYVVSEDGEPTEGKKGDENDNDDENQDIRVVKLSLAPAPADLPPLGDLVRPVPKPGDRVFAMRNALCSWKTGVVLEVTNNNGSFNTYKIHFEHKVKNSITVVSGRHLAYCTPCPVRFPIGTRVIALFYSAEASDKKNTYYSGIVAEIPSHMNGYRYLIFFDDGYAQYVHHKDARLVCESSKLVWEEVHSFSRDFVRQYLLKYPERPMVRLHPGQSLKCEWNSKWWVSKVLQVDASLVQVHFESYNRTEWIYRGSTRLAPLFLELQAAERQRTRPLPRSTQNKQNMPYVEYTRSDDKGEAQPQQTEDSKRQRAVAKKSTVPQNQTQTPHQPPVDVTSRVVYYTPKAAVKPHKMVTHTCGPKCKRTDVVALKELRTYNPLARPLLSGWERQIVRSRGRKDVLYRAPCGRRLRSLAELQRYLRITNSEMGMELFDLNPNTHCLAEFVLQRCLVSKKDLSHGKENVPVPCVNYYDNSLPEFCSYNTERTPTAGVPLNLDPEFLCGCDCTDDCEDKSKCACWKMTLDGAKTIGLDGDVGYVYKRLLEPVPSGIYECNSRCHCKQTCLNRVAQHPLQLKLQVFKTLNRGWGIRALNDVPKGSFICVYAGNLLTDATANLDGLNEGDEYLAELDYIEVVEQMKEGFEEDIPEIDKQLDKAEEDPEESEVSSSEEEPVRKDKHQEDLDFKPTYEVSASSNEYSKRLRKRDKKKKEAVKKELEKKELEKKDECITISDDEEVREPQRFSVQTGMAENEKAPKYRSVRSIFGEDEACYIVDAKVQGNIGRYLNHSCSPNVFVQNVFVDTHDPRFPWVAFFALSHVKAGTELTWNYNYDVGSVPGKVLYCYCGSPTCRGRLL